MAAVIADADLVALPIHPRHHVADAAPRVYPAVDQLQLGFGWRHEAEADGGAEEAGAGVVTQRQIEGPTR